MPIIKLSGSYGYQSYSVSNVAASTTIDASAASWIVANSRIANPDATHLWSDGTGQINCYPFKVTGAAAGLVVYGGTVWGEVPQASDWLYTYNNSAAIRIEAAPGFTIDEWRIDKAWDGIRIGTGSANFLIDDTHMSNVRDDAVENDNVLSGTIRDSLFDGVFSGISLGDGDMVDGSANVVTLEGVFLRSESYLYKGTVTHVSPIKTNSASPGLTPDIRIVNSVIAIEDPNHAGQARLQIAWDNVVESRGNVFLNLSDTPLPASYPLPPAGFTILQGQAARDYWDACKAAWLDNHDGTPVSDITALPPLPGATRPPTVGAELAPLAGAQVDHRAAGAISAAGEVDKVSLSLVAGTTYVFDLLGSGKLGSGYLANGGLALLNSSGVSVASDADSGLGLDARLSFTAPTSGSYSLQLSGTGGATGSYVLQAAATGGTADQSGTSYSVSNAGTVILESAGGIGQDVVSTSVSYALGALSEIEVLQTSNSKGKTSISLTGNDFAQTLIGNAGSNVLDGRGGADTLTGGLGNDRFVLGNPGPTGIDRITDYASGDTVDVSQLLKVAAGTNILSGGYLRVTTSGLVQVDLDGGGDGWSTLATINGSASVSVRYLSGGVATTVSASRVAETSAATTAAARLASTDQATASEPAHSGEQTSLAATLWLHDQSPLADSLLGAQSAGPAHEPARLLSLGDVVEDRSNAVDDLLASLQSAGQPAFNAYGEGHDTVFEAGSHWGGEYSLVTGVTVNSADWILIS